MRVGVGVGMALVMAQVVGAEGGVEDGGVLRGAQMVVLVLVLRLCRVSM